MKIDNFFNFLKRVDDSMDKIPIGSILNNAVDALQKLLVLPFMKKETIDKNYYYSHLEDKSFKRCAVLSIPIFGNLIVPIYDFVNSHFIRKKIEQLPPTENTSTDRSETYEYVKSLSFTEKDDPKIMKAAIQKDWSCLELASHQLQQNKEFLLSVLPASKSYSLEYVGDALKRDREFMLQTGQLNAADLSLWEDREFALGAFEQDPNYITEWISANLLNDNDFHLGLLVRVLDHVRNKTIDPQLAQATLAPLKERMQSDPALTAQVRQIFLDKVRNDNSVMDFLVPFDVAMIDDAFVLEALRGNNKMINHEQFKKRCARKEFMLEAIKITPSAYFSIPLALNDDLAFKKHAKAAFDKHGPERIGG